MSGKSRVEIEKEKKEQAKKRKAQYEKDRDNQLGGAGKNPAEFSQKEHKEHLSQKKPKNK